MLPDQHPHVGRGEREELGGLGCLDARRPALAVEHRELAEDRARTESGQRDYAPVRVLADYPAAPGADDVAGVARVALVEDPRVRRIATGDRDLRHAVELLGRELREERHTAQELDDPGSGSVLHPVGIIPAEASETTFLPVTFSARWRAT